MKETHKALLERGRLWFLSRVMMTADAGTEEEGQSDGRDRSTRGGDDIGGRVNKTKIDY